MQPASRTESADPMTLADTCREAVAHQWLVALTDRLANRTLPRKGDTVLSIYDSKRFIKEVKEHPENFYIVHYSCQSLYDDNEALSPRITSIAVTHYATEQTVSFSTHSIAEEQGIPREEVIDRFDEVELDLLQKFYAFVRDRRDRHWVHWNMRNLTFGFEHLEHRFRVLGGRDAAVIPVERRLNLNDLLADRYGDGYADHPKMKSLWDLNGGVHRHFLNGEEEVQAFRANEFIRMHNSTLAKVGFFYNIVRKMVSGKLHTASRGWGVALDRIFEGRTAKTIAFFGALIGVPISLWQVAIWTGLIHERKVQPQPFAVVSPQKPKIPTPGKTVSSTTGKTTPKQ